MAFKFTGCQKLKRRAIQNGASAYLFENPREKLWDATHPTTWFMPHVDESLGLKISARNQKRPVEMDKHEGKVASNAQNG